MVHNIMIRLFYVACVYVSTFRDVLGDVECVPITDCPNLYELLKRKPVPADALEKIRRANCGFDGFVEKVWCSATKRVEDDAPSASPKSCGRQQISAMDFRIVGGTEAECGEFPWLVKLVHVKQRERMEKGCSASLINEKFLLTAAHCVAEKIVNAFGPVRYALIGDHNINADSDCHQNDKPLMVETLEPIIHAKYAAGPEFYNDIALVPLKESVTFTDFVQPICLSDKPTSTNRLIIAGWGFTENGKFSDVKRKAEIPRVNTTECSHYYASVGVALDKMHQICAAGGRKDACSGDSGGPLMAVVDGVWYAEGVVSFGTGGACGRGERPGVYTNVPSYADWIKSSMLLYDRRLKGVDPITFI